MLKFREKNELKTLSGRVQKLGAHWASARKCGEERQRPVLDYVVVEYWYGEGMEAHICAEGVGKYRSFSNMNRQPNRGEL